MSSAIIATMEASLGDAWDEEQEEAWDALMSMLLSVVQKAYSAGALLASAAVTTKGLIRSLAS